MPNYASVFQLGMKLQPLRRDVLRIENEAQIPRSTLYDWLDKKEGAQIDEDRERQFLEWLGAP